MHVHCETVIFGQTNNILYIFDFQMPVCCSCTCWTPSSSRKDSMKEGLSIFPSCCVLCCFLGIGSLGFSEFRHGTRKLYQVVDSRLFGKTFFAPKISRSGPKVKCFEFKEKSGHWFSLNLFIMKIYCVPVQISYLGKILFLKYRPECCQSFRLQDF